MSCLFISMARYEPQHDKTNEISCAPSEDSDHPDRMVRVFAGRKGHFVGFVMRRLMYYRSPTFYVVVRLAVKFNSRKL